MRLSVKALAMTSALAWGGCLLFVGLCHLFVPTYGVGFLDVMSSVYPGFHASRTAADVAVATGYGFVDGAVGGAAFGWVYNALTRGSTK
jgi:hypothetical protein